jgi:hypothetical protein
MNVLWAVLITVVVTAVAVGAMLLVRRHAPDGSFFADGDRAAGVFGVLATGFAVLLGLIVVLAFNSYDQSRGGAEAEALIAWQLFETAQLFPRQREPKDVRRGRLLRALRRVRRMAPVGGRHTRKRAQSVGVRLFRSLETVDPLKRRPSRRRMRSGSI